MVYTGGSLGGFGVVLLQTEKKSLLIPHLVGRLRGRARIEWRPLPEDIGSNMPKVNRLMEHITLLQKVGRTILRISTYHDLCINQVIVKDRQGVSRRCGASRHTHLW